MKLTKLSKILIAVAAVLAIVLASVLILKRGNKTDTSIKTEDTATAVSTSTVISKIQPSLAFAFYGQSVNGKVQQFAVNTFDIAKQNTAEKTIKTDYGYSSSFSSSVNNNAVQWSSDGKILAYAYGDEGGMMDDADPKSFKLITEIDGTTSVVLQDIDTYQIPQWLLLPNGKQIIYLKRENNMQDSPKTLYRYDLTTKQHSQITNVDNMINPDTELIASGDQKTVFFFHRPAADNYKKLYMLSTDLASGKSSNNQILDGVDPNRAFLGAYSGSDLVISPDGKLAAYRYVINSTEHGISIYNLETKQSSDIFSAGNRRSVNNMRWSPDSKNIAFNTTNFGTGNDIGQNVEIDSINVDTKDKKRIDDFTSQESNGSIQMLNWSPDAQKIAYQKGFDLYFYDMTEGTSTIVGNIKEKNIIGIEWIGF